MTTGGGKVKGGRFRQDREGLLGGVSPTWSLWAVEAQAGMEGEWR